MLIFSHAGWAKNKNLWKFSVMAVFVSLLLTGCGDKRSWQEKLCISAIQKMARYGYEIHEVYSKNNALIKGLTDVMGSVTLDDGFGAKRKESFRCSIQNNVKATPREDDVRVWFYKNY